MNTKYTTYSLICSVYDKEAECWDLPFNMRTEKEIELAKRKLEEMEPGRYELHVVGEFINGELSRKE